MFKDIPADKAKLEVTLNVTLDGKVAKTVPINVIQYKENDTSIHDNHPEPLLVYN